MDTFIQMEKRTPYTILRTKYLDHIEKQGIVPTLKYAGLGLLSIVIWIWWSYPETMISLFWAIFGVANFLILKIIMVVFLLFAFPAMFEEIVSSLSKSAEKNDTALVWGVPCVELIDYLFEHEDFGRTAIMDRFAISRAQYADIIELLDKNNVLIRGDNNSRVLNSNLTRSMIADILIGRDEKKFGEHIGKTFDFFETLKQKFSPSEESRFTRSKIRQSAYTCGAK